MKFSLLCNAVASVDEAIYHYFLEYVRYGSWAILKTSGLSAWLYVRQRRIKSCKLKKANKGKREPFNDASAGLKCDVKQHIYMWNQKHWSLEILGNFHVKFRESHWISLSLSSFLSCKQRLRYRLYYKSQRQTQFHQFTHVNLIIPRQRCMAQVNCYMIQHISLFPSRMIGSSPHNPTT